MTIETNSTELIIYLFTKEDIKMEKSTMTVSRELLETLCMLDGARNEIIEILKGVGDVSMVIGDDKIVEEAEMLIEYIVGFGETIGRSKSYKMIC